MYRASLHYPRTDATHLVEGRTYNGGRSKFRMSEEIAPIFAFISIAARDTGPLWDNPWCTVHIKIFAHEYPIQIVLGQLRARVLKEITDRASQMGYLVT